MAPRAPLPRHSTPVYRHRRRSDRPCASPGRGPTLVGRDNRSPFRLPTPQVLGETADYTTMDCTTGAGAPLLNEQPMARRTWIAQIRIVWHEQEKIMNEATKILAVTKEEAECILDSVRVSNPQTRTLALKIAGLVLEYAADEAVRCAQEQTEQAAQTIDVR
jgi:hypothetical protein